MISAWPSLAWWCIVDPTCALARSLTNWVWPYLARPCADELLARACAHPIQRLPVPGCGHGGVARLPLRSAVQCLSLPHCCVCVPVSRCIAVALECPTTPVCAGPAFALASLPLPACLLQLLAELEALGMSVERADIAMEVADQLVDQMDDLACDCESCRRNRIARMGEPRAAQLMPYTTIHGMAWQHPWHGTHGCPAYMAVQAQPAGRTVHPLAKMMYNRLGWMDGWITVNTSRLRSTMHSSAKPEWPVRPTPTPMPRGPQSSAGIAVLAWTV